MHRGSASGRRRVALAIAAVTMLLTLVLPWLQHPHRQVAEPLERDVSGSPRVHDGEGVRAHQAALGEIADLGSGNRFSGFSGYDASSTMSSRRSRPRAMTRVQTFNYLAFEVVGPSALQQTAPNTVTYVGCRLGPITQSDPGDVTWRLRPSTCSSAWATSTSRCGHLTSQASCRKHRAAQRGTCTFRLKAENAAAAGAIGIVIFNQGNTAAPDRNGIPAVTLTANNTSGIPVIGTTYALGETLAGLILLASGCGSLPTPPPQMPWPWRARREGGPTTTTSSWPARTSTRCWRGRASTTTARAVPPSSRPLCCSPS